tara:strand:- start:328 stop:441 length:114 start_codon:yes stop_codon:yes gene_type:complete
MEHTPQEKMIEVHVSGGADDFLRNQGATLQLQQSISG